MDIAISIISLFSFISIFFFFSIVYMCLFTFIVSYSRVVYSFVILRCCQLFFVLSFCLYISVSFFDHSFFLSLHIPSPALTATHTDQKHHLHTTLPYFVFNRTLCFCTACPAVYIGIPWHVGTGCSALYYN